MMMPEVAISESWILHSNIQFSLLLSLTHALIAAKSSAMLENFGSSTQKCYSKKDHKVYFNFRLIDTAVETINYALS